MRPALQRLLGSPSALTILRNAIDSSESTQLCWSCWSYNTVQSKIRQCEYSSGIEGTPIREVEQKWRDVDPSKKFDPVISLECSVNAARSRLGRTSENKGRRKPKKSIWGASRDSTLGDVEERKWKARKLADQHRGVTSKPKPGSKPASISLEKTQRGLTYAHLSQGTSPRKARPVNERPYKLDSRNAPEIKRSSVLDDSWRDAVEQEPQLSLVPLEKPSSEEKAVFFDPGSFHTQDLDHGTISCDSWCNVPEFEHQSSIKTLEELYIEGKANDNGLLDPKRSLGALLVNNKSRLQPSSKKKPKRRKNPTTNLRLSRDQERSLHDAKSSMRDRCKVSKKRLRAFSTGKYLALREGRHASDRKIQDSEDKTRGNGRQIHHGGASPIKFPAVVVAKQRWREYSISKDQKAKKKYDQRKSKPGPSSSGKQPSTGHFTRHPIDGTMRTPNTKTGLKTGYAILTRVKTAKRELNKKQAKSLKVFKKIPAPDNIIRKHAVFADDPSPPSNVCSIQDCTALTERSIITWELESSAQDTDAESSLSWGDCMSFLSASASRVVDPKAQPFKSMTRIDVSVSDTAQKHPPLGYSDGWRSKLMTSEQYEYESSVDLPASKGPRLLDLNQHASNFELWLELISYRRRAHGVRGPKPLWNLIQSRDIELPTDGSTAHRLWTTIVQMALVDSRVLPSLVEYAVNLQLKTNRHWRQLYITVMRYLIIHNSSQAHRRMFYYYHTKLYARFPPTIDHFLDLFDLVHKRRKSLTVDTLKLQRVYDDLPYRNLYSRVMTSLYKYEDFEAAASWHILMVTRKDVPSELQTYRPVFRYMALYGSVQTLAIMVDKMVEAGVPLPSFINHPLPISPTSQEIIDRRLAEVHGIKPSPITDAFCARLFATGFFSVETVVYFLRMAGAKSIGPLSIQAIAVRENCEPITIASRIKQLESSGISLERSTYCTLVSRLAVEENARLLENVVRCDLHPEAFDDKDLQESLLGVYHADGDQLQIDRTLAILMATCPEEHVTKTHWNVQLRLRLRQRNIPAIGRILEAMYTSGIVVEPKSSSYVRRCLLTRRAIGKRPHYVYDLPIIINIWQIVLKSGGIVPANAWIEILRRLGMTGQLEEYERLALWLAGYYLSTAGSKLSLLPTSQVISKEFTRRLIMVPTRLRTRVGQHPLRVLFPPRVQQAIVAWGFQHARIGGSNWRWGLHLLLKLKRLGVYIGRETVARACRQRLGILFGSRQPSKRINRRLRAGNTASLEQYLRDIEKIGGKSLFFGRAYPEDDDERIKLLLERFGASDRHRLEGPPRIRLISPRV